MSSLTPTASVHARGTQDPEHVAGDRGQDAEVEERARPAQHPALEQLRRARAPAVLVAPVAPPEADDEDRQRRVGQDDVEQRLAAGHGASLPPIIGRAAPGPSSGITSGGAKGSSPTSSLGGPSAARRLIRASFADPSRPHSGRDHVEQRRERARLPAQAGADELDRDPIVLEQRRPGSGARAANSSISGRKSGSSSPGRLEPGGPVGLLEPRASPARAGGGRRGRGRSGAGCSAC